MSESYVKTEKVQQPKQRIQRQVFWFFMHRISYASKCETPYTWSLPMIALHVLPNVLRSKQVINCWMRSEMWQCSINRCHWSCLRTIEIAVSRAHFKADEKDLKIVNENYFLSGKRTFCIIKAQKFACERSVSPDDGRRRDDLDVRRWKSVKPLRLISICWSVTQCALCWQS